MADDVKIKVTADGNQAIRELERVGSQGKDSLAKVDTAAESAGASLDRVGDEATEGLGKVDRAAEKVVEELKDVETQAERTGEELKEAAEEAEDPFKDLREQLSKLNEDLDKLREAAGVSKLETEFDRVNKQVGRLARTTLSPIRQFEILQNQFKAASDAFDKASSSLDFQPASKQAQKLREEVKRTAAAVIEFAERGEDELDDVRRAASLVGVELKDAKEELQEFDRLGTGGKGLGSLVSGFNKLRAAVVALGVAFAFRETTRFIQNSVDAASELTRAQRVLNVATEDGAEAFRFARKTADDLRVPLLELAAGYGQISAAAKNTEITQEAVANVTLGVVEAQRALGLSSSDLSGILAGLQKIISNNRVQAEELDIITNRLPGAMELVASAVGLTTGEFRKQAEQGKILARDLIPALGDALRERYSKAAREALQDTEDLTPAITRLSNELLILRGEFGKAFSREVFESLDDLPETLTAAESAAAGLGSVFGQATEAIGRFLSRDPNLRRFLENLEAIGRADRLQGLQVAAARVEGAFVKLVAQGVPADEAIQKVAKAAKLVGDRFEEAGEKTGPFLTGILKRLEQIEVQAEATGKAGASGLAALSREGRALVEELQAVGPRLETSIREVVEAFTFLSNEQQLTGVAAVELEKKLKAVFSALEAAGQDIPENLLDIRDALEETIGSGGRAGAIYRSIADEVKGLTRDAGDLVGAYDLLSQRNELTADSAALLSRKVVDVRDRFRALGAEAPREILDLKDALDEVTQSAGRLSEATQKILQEIADSERALREETEGVVTAFDTLENSGQLTANALEVLEDRSDSLLKKYQEIGIEAPDALLAVADAVEDPAVRTERLLKVANETVDAFGRLKDIAGEIPEVDLFGDSMGKGQASAADAQKRLRELAAKPVLSPEELNESFQLQTQLVNSQRDLARATQIAGEEQLVYASNLSDRSEIERELLDLTTEVERASQDRTARLQDNVELFGRLNERLRENAGALQVFRDETITGTDGLEEYASFTGDLGESMEDAGIKIEKAGEASQEFQDKQSRSIEVLKNLQDNTDRVSVANEAYTDSLRKSGAEAEKTVKQQTEDLGKLKDAHEQVAESVGKVTQAQQELISGAAGYSELIRLCNELLGCTRALAGAEAA